MSLHIRCTRVRACREACCCSAVDRRTLPDCTPFCRCSKVHEGSRTLPGELPGSELSTASTGTATQQADTAAATSTATAAAPPPPPAVPPPTPLPDLDALPHLFVSFGNAAYFELAHNWARSVQQVGAPFLIAGAPRPTKGRTGPRLPVCTLA